MGKGIKMTLKMAATAAAVEAPCLSSFVSVSQAKLFRVRLYRYIKPRTCFGRLLKGTNSRSSMLAAEKRRDAFNIV